MTPEELQRAMQAAVEKWFKATGMKWPPNPTNWYSFTESWSWLEINDPPLVKFIDELQGREIAETYFSVFSEQAWRR